MRQGLFPIWTCFAVTAVASWKIFDESSITVASGIDNSDWHNRFCKQCFVVPFWYNETLLQAMSLYIQRPLPCKRLLGAAQTRCSASCRCRLRVFAKCSFGTPQECAAITEAWCSQGLGLHPNKQNTHGKFAMPCVFWPLCAQRHGLQIQCHRWNKEIISSQTVIWLRRFPKHSNIEVQTGAESGKIACLVFIRELLTV